MKKQIKFTPSKELHLPPECSELPTLLDRKNRLLESYYGINKNLFTI